MTVGILLAAVIGAATGAAAADEPLPDWRVAADRLIGTPPESYAFNWGEGVQMMGLMRAARATDDSRYTDYVEKWARLYEPRDLNVLLNIGDAGGNPSRRGYCGHWSAASAALYLYQERRRPEHLRLAEAVARFIRSGAERSPEGGLGHWQGSHQYWVDTLYMACPLLAGLGAMQNRREYVEDAAAQILVQARHLEDARTGLFYHMWDWQAGTRSEGYWGRGNGWVLMSLAETLEAMKKSDARYGDLETIARKLAHGLEPTQDTDGVWHTILDDPASYPECSATAMITYGLLKLARLGVLPATVRSRAMTAWRAINSRYVKDGLVTGVSAGTGPSGRDSYRAVAVGTETWGTGAYLLAAAEIAGNAGKR